jgi:hypothetical protein
MVKVWGVLVRVQSPQPFLRSVMTPDFGNKLEGPFHFYGGAVTLMFNREEWQYYRVLPNGEMTKVDGVTTPIHIIDKSAALTPWAAKMVVEKAFRLFPLYASQDGLQIGSPGVLHLDRFQELLGEAKTAPRDKLEDAGNIGHQAHTLIEENIKAALTSYGGIVPIHKIESAAGITDERVLNCVNAALGWMREHKVRWLSTERMIYSQFYNYAGTMDGLCVVDGKRCIVDWKTSNYLYPEYAYQTAAYQYAYVEETGQVIQDRWILRLGKEDGKFEPWYIKSSSVYNWDFKTFLLCCELTRAHNDGIERMKEYRRSRRKQNDKT